MNGFRFTLVSDLRLQHRNGFYYASLFLATVLVLILRWLPAELSLFLLPVVVLEAVLVNSFYFAAALLQLERNEGTPVALAVTPLPLEVWLFSRLTSLTALSLTEGLVIALAMAGPGPQLMGTALAILLMAPPLCLLGIALVLKHPSLNAFLLPSALYTLVLSLPLLGWFGLGAASLWWLHPLNGPLLLMAPGAELSTTHLLIALALPLLCLPLAWTWALRGLVRTRQA